ncbi:MAG: hypothetical protein JWO56_1409 [Acidobacteria bacterium]|nr:hypothetical protein [Acidobacteriota bacterium]
MFDAEAALAAFRAEFAVIDPQFRALSERHRGLQQAIEGLETLLASGGMPTPEAPAATRADVSHDRSMIANVVSALRWVGRPVTAAELQRVIEHGGMAVKRDTVYKALRRASDAGLVSSDNLRFSLPGWEGAGG